jgi:hypothetical protein
VDAIQKHVLGGHKRTQTIHRCLFLLPATGRPRRADSGHTFTTTGRLANILRQLLILAFWSGPAVAVNFGPPGRCWLGFVDGATEA